MWVLKLSPLTPPCLIAPLKILFGLFFLQFLLEHCRKASSKYIQTVAELPPILLLLMVRAWCGPREVPVHVISGHKCIPIRLTVSDISNAGTLTISLLLAIHQHILIRFPLRSLFQLWSPGIVLCCLPPSDPHFSNYTSFVPPY